MSQFAFQLGDYVKYTGDDPAAGAVGSGITGTIVDLGTRSEVKREQHVDTVRNPLDDTEEELAYSDVVTNVITETIMVPVYVITFPDRMDPVTIVGDDDAQRYLSKVDGE